MTAQEQEDMELARKIQVSHKVNTYQLLMLSVCIGRTGDGRIEVLIAKGVWLGA